MKTMGMEKFLGPRATLYKGRLKGLYTSKGRAQVSSRCAKPAVSRLAAAAGSVCVCVCMYIYIYIYMCIYTCVH